VGILKKSFFWIAGITLSLILIVFISYQYQERQTKKTIEKIDDIFSKQKSSMNYETDERREKNPDKNAYFGDLHVHTENSFDAYTFGTTASPADAYKYARGEAIKHPTGYHIQLSRPLDFYAVTDHGVFLGVVKEAADPNSEIGQYELTKPLHNMNENISNSIFSIVRRAGTFRPFAQELANNIQDGTVDMKILQKVSNDTWLKTIEAADQAYVPGSFTTFAAYEYSSSVEIYDNYLHRNVIFRDTKNSFISL